jgi:deoxycytidylate deaminase
MSEIGSYAGAELVLGLVAPVGTDFEKFIDTLSVCLQSFGYQSSGTIRLSDLVATFQDKTTEVQPPDGSAEYMRLMQLMSMGNAARQRGGGDILALGAAASIHAKRRTNKHGQQEPLPKHAHLIRSLKHPAEVLALRRIYGSGFFLIGVISEPAERRDFLENRKGCRPEEITTLRARDEHEGDIGQRTRDTFELADVFLRLGDTDGIKRFLRLVFGDPYETPTPDEYSMFLAFAAALRSGDLSRQVGAVIVSAAGDVVAVGTNDVPTSGGGLCWPGDHDDRDLRHGHDTNQTERAKIVDEILRAIAPDDATEEGAMTSWIMRGWKKLRSAAVMDITEYGRAVHAEMEALLSCARSGITTRQGTLFSTTFPCHNCAKHIIAAGLRRVVYVEPYPKSRAKEFYRQSIMEAVSPAREALETKGIGPVLFEPFRGVGPRRFFDLFSIRLSSGYPVRRKDDGQNERWAPSTAKIRVPLLPNSYITREAAATVALRAMTASRSPQGDR